MKKNSVSFSITDSVVEIIRRVANFIFCFNYDCVMDAIDDKSFDIDIYAIADCESFFRVANLIFDYDSMTFTLYLYNRKDTDFLLAEKSIFDFKSIAKKIALNTLLNSKNIEQTFQLEIRKHTKRSIVK